MGAEEGSLSPWERRARESELIFVGAVERLGPPPPHWSGYYASHQQVWYRVDETIKGAVAERELVVSHLVVKNSPTADPDGAVGLSRRLFADGARLLVMARAATEGQCSSPSERFGAMPLSAALVEQIRGLVAPR